MRIIHLPIFPESPTNPARVDVRSGVIEINDARWRTLSDTEKAFVLQHEIGHYKARTLDEVKADQYALRQLALKRPYSLRDYLNAVDEVSYGNDRRVSQAKYDVLRIAADNGSEKARELLSLYAAADGSKVRNSSRWIWMVVLLVLVGAMFMIKA